MDFSWDLLIRKIFQRSPSVFNMLMISQSKSIRLSLILRKRTSWISLRVLEKSVKFLWTFQMTSKIVGIQDDLNRIEKWAEIFNDPSKLLSTLTANVLKNYGAIEADINNITSDFNATHYK